MIKIFTFLHYRLQHFFHCYFPTNTWHVPPMYNHMACTPMACTHDHCLYGSSIEEVCAFVIFEPFSHWVYMLRFILRLLYFFRFHFIWGGRDYFVGGGGEVSTLLHACQEQSFNVIALLLLEKRTRKFFHNSELWMGIFKINSPSVS